MKRYTIGILMMFLFINISLAQTADTAVKSDELQTTTTSVDEVGVAPADPTPTLSKKELRRQRVAKRNLHYNILGGPSYTPDFGLLIGGSALMTFRMNPSDTTQQRSVVPMAIALMFEGGLNLFTKPQLFFKGDRFRIFGVFAYKNTLENFYGIGYSTNKDYPRGEDTSEYRYSGVQVNPWFLFRLGKSNFFAYKNTLENFYGIGYSTNKDYPRGEDTSEYRYSGVQVNPWFLFRLGKSNFFAGPQIDFNYDKITKPAAGMIEQPSYIAAGGTDHGYSNLSSGVGFLLTYDTRDVPANAYRGTYLDFRGMMYNKAFGSDNNFYRLEIDYRQYKTLGKRKVLAWTVQTKNVFGNVPLTKYALSGTPFDLRGYYMGQFRDKSSHVMMAEYRQMINTDKSNWVKKMLNHVGYVAWGGCGFMGPTPGKIEGVLPNLGLGLRIEVQPRMNVRLDFGRDMVNKQNLFYFNMTEAF